MVSTADAAVCYRAMVVEHPHAVVAYPTVLGAQRPEDTTWLAIPRRIAPSTPALTIPAASVEVIATISITTTTSAAATTAAGTFVSEMMASDASLSVVAAFALQI